MLPLLLHGLALLLLASDLKSLVPRIYMYKQVYVCILAS